MLSKLGWVFLLLEGSRFFFSNVIYSFLLPRGRLNPIFNFLGAFFPCDSGDVKYNQFNDKMVVFLCLQPGDLFLLSHRPSSSRGIGPSPDVYYLNLSKLYQIVG